jgi:predicted nucleotidyltransferase component of viral defense system
MSKETIKEWLSFNEQTRRNIYNEVALRKGIPDNAIEKDWWVVQTLTLLFSMSCAPHLIFKGGTSLSKGWNLIERFSEDIDLVIDRKFLGFTGDLTTRDIKNLRKASKKYIVAIFTEELQAAFIGAGFADVQVKAREFVSSGQDPMIVEIYYPKLTEPDSYLKPGILVEVGSRSLVEPFTPCSFRSLVADIFADSAFADEAITVPTANPERTFLEKTFLLHEEFQKPAERIRVERLSRHLYDLEKLMQLEVCQAVLNNAELFNTIVKHRSKLTPLAEVDYTLHQPKSIRFLPPKELLPDWEADYQQMQEYMIYGKSLPFRELMDKLSQLQRQINNIEWE